MSDFPGPVNADDADEAEARRQNLRNRFRAVSRGIDRRGGGPDGGAPGGGSFSFFEIAIGIAIALFALWAAVQTMGLG